MKILHYSLGFPPYRSGGLVKFCIDLMVEQKRMGHDVALLWPGKIGLIKEKVEIKKRGFVRCEDLPILSLELINPLPISYDEGISQFNAFQYNCKMDVYYSFLSLLSPDIIHIHTLMGIHKGFFYAAKELNIRIVFTAHDFFPICPKVTMYRKGAICSQVDSCSECGLCNKTALSISTIKLLQSSLYRRLKESSFMKKLRKNHRDNFFDESFKEDFSQPVGTPKDYIKLRNYYTSMLNMVDIIHYNSSITKKIYDRFLFLSTPNHVIEISHSDIKDNKIEKDFSDPVLRIRYLGPNSGAKGFFVLKNALDMLWKVRRDFRLDIHFTPSEEAPYIKAHPRYSYDELKSIFLETDILIAPSVWYETFGYTVLEALSFGVPVIISDTVGAKDILAQGAGIIIDDISSNKIFEVLSMLDRQKLISMNQTILNKQHIMMLSEVEKKIEESCYKF